MTRTALHPHTLEELDIVKWELKYKAIDIKPLCPVCRKELFIRASSTPDKASHFVHYKNSGCPTIDENRKKYEGLRPVEMDFKNAKKIKKEFINNMWLVYQKCNSLCSEDPNKKGLNQKQFKKMVDKATENDIWYYKGLTLEYLPYVLLVNYGVFRELKRKCYFVFDSKLTNYDDLWTKGKVKKKIWKVYYEDNDVKGINIDFNTSDIATDYFMFYVLGLQQNKKEEKFFEMCEI